MNITKNPIRPVRDVAPGFGWADHRLLRDGHLRACSTQALALYLLLVLAADGQGLSYYGDRLVRHLLGLSGDQLENARDCLVRNGLVAYEAPLYQVLAVPARPEGGAAC